MIICKQGNCDDVLIRHQWSLHASLCLEHWLLVKYDINHSVVYWSCDVAFSQKYAKGFSESCLKITLFMRKHVSHDIWISFSKQLALLKSNISFENSKFSELFHLVFKTFENTSINQSLQARGEEGQETIDTRSTNRQGFIAARYPGSVEMALTSHDLTLS